MSNLGSLTLYGANSTVSAFEDLIRAEVPAPLEERNFSGQDEDGNDWDARLYLWQSDPKPPAWLGFVQAGFGPDVVVPDRASSAAVIAVRVHYYLDRYFALTLGGGRFKLDRARIERGYGLRVALNAIYEDDDETATLSYLPRVRQVETRTVGAQTMRALQQANRLTDFDAFGTDAELDQLAGITGTPAHEALGRRVTGKDSFRIGRKTPFDDLGKVCREIARRSTKKTYQKRFDYIDRVTQIDRPSLVDDLRDLAIQSLSQGGDFEIAPPELVNFDAIDQFELILPDGDSAVFVDPTPEAIRDTIIAAAGPLTSELVERCQLLGKDSADGLYASWALWECLDAQLDNNGDTYLLRDGDFYRVDPGYLTKLNRDLGVIQQSTIVLPDSHREPQSDGTIKEIDEGTYNEKAANSSPDYLNLDTRTVRAEGHASPIEICDILSTDGQLVHVKRKFSSSSLSHLFSQGAVSGRLLVSSPDFRQAVRDKIGAENPFSVLFPEPIVAANFEIVYGIIGKWTNRTITDLPFFSKVNLARHARDLRTIGYRVTYAPIGVE